MRNLVVLASCVFIGILFTGCGEKPTVGDAEVTKSLPEKQENPPSVKAREDAPSAQKMQNLGDLRKR